MRSIRYSLLTLGMMSVLFSCKTKLEQAPVDAGSADFSRYVAVGNSLTAGMADGALYLSGQQQSYPVMLSEQFKLAGGGEFKVPWMDAGAGNDGSGGPRRILGLVAPCNSTTPALSPISDPAGGTALGNVSGQGPFNLVGVPGIRAIDANFGLYSLLNPFINRFCQSPGTSTLLSEAMRVNATFFTLWLGSNDALGYATGGAVPPSGLLGASLSDPTQVKANIQQMVDSLTKNGAKGVIANIPDVTSIPYFTTVPWNAANLSQGKADSLNAAYAGLGMSHITWSAGANGLVIVDSMAPGFRRHATANDLILIVTPGDSLRCGQWGTHPGKPLADRYVLDQAEVAQIQTAIAAYNAGIAEIAAAKGLALADMNTYLKTFKSGFVYNGVTMNASFVTGGAFSLDGIHCTPRGYALIANVFIRAINATYGSTLPEVDVTKYPGVLFPK